MAKKLALKKLTASDLTFFEWHFRNRNAGNQKAINLNRDVFIDKLYPSLPSIAQKSNWRVPLDLTLYGPGLHREYNLQRKIIKGGTYKNWRLDGEFIFNPAEDPERFNSLEPSDFMLIDFQGDLCPVSARAFFIARRINEDRDLQKAFGSLIGGRSMMTISVAMLEDVVSGAAPSGEHPVYETILDRALEDASQNGLEGTRKLLRRRSGRKLSQVDLERARQNATAIGQIGEEFVNAHLERLRGQGLIAEVEWASTDNAISPYDFKVRQPDGRTVLVEVKSTRGEFERKFHISISELERMSQGPERYDIYRTFELSDYVAKLRIAEDVRQTARGILDLFEQLPDGVTADSVSVSPQILSFGREIDLSMTDDEEGEDSQTTQDL